MHRGDEITLLLIDICLILSSVVTYNVATFQSNPDCD
jgi:hypothetical protein